MEFGQGEKEYLTRNYLNFSQVQESLNYKSSLIRIIIIIHHHNKLDTLITGRLSKAAQSYLVLRQF